MNLKPYTRFFSEGKEEEKEGRKRKIGAIAIGALGTIGTGIGTKSVYDKVGGNAYIKALNSAGDTFLEDKDYINKKYDKLEKDRRSSNLQQMKEIDSWRDQELKKIRDLRNNDENINKYMKSISEEDNPAKQILKKKNKEALEKYGKMEDEIYKIVDEKYSAIPKVDEVLKKRQIANDQAFEKYTKATDKKVLNKIERKAGLKASVPLALTGLALTGAGVYGLSKKKKNKN